MPTLAMNKLYHLLLLNVLLFPLFCMVSCEADDQLPVILPEKTVLIYMVADNNLSNSSIANIDSLLAGITRYGTGQNNILVYLDNTRGLPTLLRLYKNEKGAGVSETIKEYPEQNSISPSVMSSVLADMENLFPAQSYGLVLWSHGYGWLPAVRNTKAPSTRWFGQDDNNQMNISELADALSYAPKFDYILFDACFMAGVEVAYELRYYTDYFIASPAEVLSAGFPYSRLVPYLLGSGQANSINLASTYFNWYNEQTGWYRSATISCVKCAEMDSFAAATRTLIGASLPLINALDVSKIQNLDSYSPHLFFDFAHLTESFSSSPGYAEFKEQFSKTIIYSACTQSITTISSAGFVTRINPISFGGIGCFIPQQATGIYNESFRQSAWYMAAGWNLTIWK